MNAGTHDPDSAEQPHHTADPSALEDPVHRDVAEHELHEEHEEREEYEEHAGREEPESGQRVPVEPTGDERVDMAVRRLGEVASHPPAEHIAVYEDVHRRLQDTLADLDGR